MRLFCAPKNWRQVTLSCVAGGLRESRVLHTILPHLRIVWGKTKDILSTVSLWTSKRFNKESSKRINLTPFRSFVNVKILPLISFISKTRVKCESWTENSGKFRKKNPYSFWLMFRIALIYNCEKKLSSDLSQLSKKKLTFSLRYIWSTVTRKYFFEVLRSSSREAYCTKFAVSHLPCKRFNPLFLRLFSLSSVFKLIFWELKIAQKIV